MLAVAAHCRLRADGDADGVLLRIASEQTPALAGLAGRWWSRLGRTLRGTYLFDDEPVHLIDLYEREGNRTRQSWTLPYAPGRRLAEGRVQVGIFEIV